MKEEELKRYTEITGNPFSDIGGLVIEVMAELYPDKDIRGLMDVATDVYLNHWNGKMHDFFPNSALTNPNPAFSKNRAEKVSKYLDSLFEKSEQGVCSITGQEGDVYLMDRTNGILCGCNAHTNGANSILDKGIYVCREILIRNYFMPLGCYRYKENASIVVSNNIDTMRKYVKMFCSQNIKKDSDGICKDKSINIKKLYCETEGKECFVIWRFSNFGQGACIQKEEDKELCKLSYYIKDKTWKNFLIKWNDVDDKNNKMRNKLLYEALKEYCKENAMNTYNINCYFIYCLYMDISKKQVKELQSKIGYIYNYMKDKETERKNFILNLNKKDRVIGIVQYISKLWRDKGFEDIFMETETLLKIYNSISGKNFRDYINLIWNSYENNSKEQEL